MLTIFGNSSRFCDGLSRRNFLKIGALGLGGLTLPQLLRAEAQAGIRSSNKSIIMIYLPGGPSHQDLFDIKTDAPAEVRGEFKPIKTNVDGIEICELFPHVAKMADKMVFIRSLVGSEGSHSSYQCLTGHVKRGAPMGGWPALGSVMSKLKGAADPAVPPFVSLSGTSSRSGELHGFLGISHAPFSPSGQGRRDMTLNGVTLDRLGDRKELLHSLDTFRRDVDSNGQLSGMDTFGRQAMDVLTSSKLVDALSSKVDDPKEIDRYTGGTGKFDGDLSSIKSFITARRLVEAGARCVTLSYGGWDTHSNNFTSMRKRVPALDIGVSALVQDLYERGIGDDVSIVVWGEFGRTPKINSNAGRDHWPRVSCALLAGGGMKTGQVIGKTDRLGGEAADRPVHFGEVFSTLYHNLGIDPNRTTVPDLSGRPQYLVDGNRLPLRELV